MKIFSVLAFILFVPLASAFARTVTVEVTDVLTYESLTAFGDGTKRVMVPKVYDYYLGASSGRESEDNARAVCQFIGMSYFHHEVSGIERQVRTINFTFERDGTRSKPWFGWGGEYHTTVLNSVLCQP